MITSLSKGINDSKKKKRIKYMGLNEFLGGRKSGRRVDAVDAGVVELCRINQK